MKQVILLFPILLFTFCSEQKKTEKPQQQIIDSITGLPIEKTIDNPKNLTDSIVCLCIKDEICQYYDGGTEDFKFAKDLKEIILVSYKKPRSPKEPIISNDIRKSGVICQEEIILNKEQVSCLRKILFNFIYSSGPIYTGNMDKEGFPTHCILFKNKEGIVIDYIELDFGRYIAEPKDWKEFHMRLKVQTEALELLMKKSGIKHGFNLKN